MSASRLMPICDEARFNYDSHTLGGNRAETKRAVKHLGPKATPARPCRHFPIASPPLTSQIEHGPVSSPKSPMQRDRSIPELP